jgi:hypothetical protein
MSIRVPASLKVTVPLILLGFAATLSTVNSSMTPQAERRRRKTAATVGSGDVSWVKNPEYLLPGAI